MPHVHGSAAAANRRGLTITLVLVVGYMIAEVIGGLVERMEEVVGGR